MPSRNVIALPNPALLVWARETMGLDIESVAKKLKVPTERIHSWEAGQDKPTLAQLRRLGDFYKRPLAVFYLPERTRDFQPLRDFRRPGHGRPHRISPNLMLAIRVAGATREWAMKLCEALGGDPPRFHGALTRDDRIEEAGS